MVEKLVYNLYTVKFYEKIIWTQKTGFSSLYSPKRTNDRLTGNKDLCGCLCLSSSVTSETLEYSSISWLHPAHRQPGCCGDFVAWVGQFGKWHRVFKPLDLGLGHTYTFSRIRKVSGGIKRISVSLIKPWITLTLTAEQTSQHHSKSPHTSHQSVFVIHPSL